MCAVWSLCWYLGVIAGCFSIGSSTDLFTRDGVLVRSQGEVRTVSAVWQLVVLITPPRRPPVEAWFSQVRDHVGTLNRNRWFDNVHHWNLKLDVLQAKMEQEPVEIHQVVAERPKRGLFDAVGVTASWLFGTVSHAQLNKVQLAITSNSLRTRALKHNQEHMLSIMNSTRNIQIKLAEHVSVMERMLALAADEAEDMEATSNEVLLALRVRLAVEELDSVIGDYLAKKATHHRMEMQLERGLLTEKLLEPAQLVLVLEAARTAGFRGLGLHWYYQHARVEPVWGPDASIAFRLGLLMVSQDTYSAYHLTYLPVLIDDKHLRTVVGKPMVAVSTRRKASFYPEACVGSQPIVCYPAMELTYQACEAALVTGTRPEDCILRITKIQDTVSATVVAPVEGMGSVSIAPHELHIDVTVRCAGKPQINRKVAGPTLLQVPEACMVEGRGWLLRTLTVKHETVNLQRMPARLDLPALNVSWPPVLHPVMREQLERLPELQVPLMSMNGLVEVPDGYVRTEHFSILWYCFVVCVGLTLLLGGGYIYYRCQARCKGCRRPKKKIVVVAESRDEAVCEPEVLIPPSPPMTQKETVVRYKPYSSLLELAALPYPR